MEEAVRLIKRDSRRFAKRQLTWFRRERDVTWIDLNQFADKNALLDHMEDVIRNTLSLQ
jgi:tRNA dimethylallyltransferase